MRHPSTIELELLSLTAAGHGSERIDDLLDEWNLSLAVLGAYGMQLWPE